MMTLNVGVLVSGRGSNLEAILKSIKRGSLKGVQVKVVVSNRRDARALEIARLNNVATSVVEGSGLSSEELGRQILAVLSRHGVLPGEGLVLLAGFMKVLPRSFVEKYNHRIMNIHPSLLPAFPGLEAQRQALEYGAKVAGCTVHFVVPEVDAGPIILQRSVPVLEGDDEEALSARILRQEHRIYPEAVRLFAEGRLSVRGRKVVAA